MLDNENWQKSEELDRLLNDPDYRWEASRVWSLLAELSTAVDPSVARKPVKTSGDFTS